MTEGQTKVHLPRHTIVGIHRTESFLRAGSFAKAADFIVRQYLRWPTLLLTIPLKTVRYVDVSSDFEEFDMLTQMVRKLKNTILPRLNAHDVTFGQDEFASVVTLLVDDFESRGMVRSVQHWEDQEHVVNQSLNT